MLTRDVKQKQITKLSAHLSKSKASFVVNCIGLNAQQITNLRKNLKQKQGDVQIIRNSLSLLALKDHPPSLTCFEPFLAKGPNAFVVAYQDIVQVAKVIYDFSKDHDIFKIKGAVLNGKAIDINQIKILASLPSEQVLRGQFVAVLGATMVKFLLTMKEVPQGLLRVFSAKQN